MTTEQRKEYIIKLRYRYFLIQIDLADFANSTKDLMQQKNKIIQSNTVDTTELEKRLE